MKNAIKSAHTYAANFSHKVTSRKVTKYGHVCS